jgi:PiT family inorganic phosphate transporter
MDIHGLIQTGAFLPIVLGLVFIFSNGFRDSSTIVATVVSTRVLSPTFAFLLCALFEFFGSFFIGSSVAATVRGTVLGPSFSAGQADLVLVLECSLIAAIGWGILSWWRAWPTSNNQALIAGLVGSSVATWGVGHFRNGIVFIVLGILVSSPLIGFGISTVMNSLLRKAGEWMTPKMKPVAEGFHVLACLIVSSAHGSNDSQLVLGVLGAMLATLHFFSLPAAGASLVLPVGFQLIVAMTISCGVLLGGRRILKKLGMKFFRLRDTEGLGAQLSSAATILACNLTGFPASTTQVISGSIVGAGVAKNPRAVRWHIVREIVLSWVVTLPSVAAISFVMCKTYLNVVGH